MTSNYLGGLLPSFQAVKRVKSLVVLPETVLPHKIRKKEIEEAEFFQEALLDRRERGI